ncbi:Uncharacterised protein [Capnocytophaga ochracea]|uniref:Uncharacterized protein n=1 Tax=Capnocytophaga ochracea TaxID=1018 RepID=A0A2X2SVQ1_CAPOC|nr:hypothetical protein [Capnocytophaga ochracea]SQA94359.1 Uncharacterised protein [Capnocytophaga ochracea]SQA94367.1 Uncharacterised protein [Capnocytophaga ochracea]
MITSLGISEAYFKLLYNVGYALMAIIALVWAYQMDRGNEDKLPSLFQNTLYLSLCFILLRL